jgi:biotin operon repressor
VTLRDLAREAGLTKETVWKQAKQLRATELR